MTGSPNRRSDDTFAVPWAIVAAALDTAADVVDPRHATRTAAPDAHCAACQGKHIEAFAPPDGPLYHRCLDCHRLWRVAEGRTQLITQATVIGEAPDREHIHHV